MSKSHENNHDNEELIAQSLESAAHEAAMADGLIPADGSDSKMKKAGLRRGKWTAEEESYANRLIYEFKLGLLPLTDGTTLRTFLSKLLNCDPMRISKKFVGQNCIGKQVFRRRQQDLEKLTPEQIETSRKELAELERKFLERVAQTNRTKTSGVKVVKDGRPDDENGSHSIAPWMVPPDEVQSVGNDSAQRSLNQAPTTVSNPSTSFPNKDQSFNPSSSFPSSAQTQNNRMIGYGVGPDMLTVDYQHVISANNALMSQIYQGAQYPYMPNYSLPPNGYMRPEYHMNGSMNPSTLKPDQMGVHYPPYDHYYRMDPMRGMHLPNQLLDANGQFRNDAFPWGQSSVNSHELHPPSSNGNESSLMPQYQSNPDWQLQSILGTGESMENIVQFLSQYQANSQSFENVQSALSNGQGKKEDGKEDTGKEAEKSTDSIKKLNDDVGYPLDDGNATNGTIRTLKNSPSSEHGVSLLKNEVSKIESKKDAHELNGYIIPSDAMASMAPMYQRNGLSDPTGRMGPPFMAAPSTVKGTSDATASAGFATANGSSSGNNNMPRNSSIENFWMLVNMGDLPRPDQDVLSETIWEAHQVVPKSMQVPSNLKPDTPISTTPRQATTVVPTSSLTLGRIKEEPAASSSSKSVYSNQSKITPPLNVNTTTNWNPQDSRKRSEETMSDRSASYNSSLKSSADGVPFTKKVKIEKE